jgi:hypothetical protein
MMTTMTNNLFNDNQTQWVPPSWEETLRAGIFNSPRPEPEEIDNDQQLNTTAAVAVQKPRWKWSGEDDEPFPPGWDQDDDDEEAEQDWWDYDWDWDGMIPQYAAVLHTPFMNLTEEERDKKRVQFTFGLCSDCDAGLDDESEFVCETRPNGAFVLTCNACSDYYRNLAFMRVEKEEERGGCN